MYRYNFPGRKQKRRQEALERLKKVSARDEAHSKYVKGAIEKLEEKLKDNVV
jgi:hypothetical protein